MNSELLKEAESVEEVMGIVGHEIAHVELRHVLKSTLEGFGSLAGFALVGFIVNADFALVLLKGTEFLELKYLTRRRARGRQTGSGAAGQRRDLDGRGSIAFFTRLGNKRGGVEQALSILSTHPASTDRTASLQQLATEPRVQGHPAGHPRWPPRGPVSGLNWSPGDEGLASFTRTAGKINAWPAGHGPCSHSFRTQVPGRPLGQLPDEIFPKTLRAFGAF